MRFSTTFFALLPAAASVFGASLPQARGQIPSGTCITLSKNIGIYHFQYSSSCVNLITNCLDNALENNQDIWSHPSCVAAAACGGTFPLTTLAQCKDSSFEPSAAPNLNYDVYASIVGECAWQEGGCPITQQNFVDLVFSQLSAVGASSYPTIQEVLKFWGYIVEWTATGDTVPYTNFNDWLRYSNSQ